MDTKAFLTDRGRERRLVFLVACCAALLFAFPHLGWVESRQIGQAFSMLDGDFPGLGSWAGVTDDKAWIRGRWIPMGTFGQTIVALPGVAFGRLVSSLTGEEALPRECAPALLKQLQAPGGPPAPRNLPLGAAMTACLVILLVIVIPSYGCFCAAFHSALPADLAPSRRRGILAVVILGAPFLLWAKLPVPAMPSIACSAWAAVLCCRNERRDGLAGFLAGMGLLLYINQSLWFMFLAATSLILGGRRSLGRFVAGAMPPLAVLWGYNVLATGSLWMPVHLFRGTDMAILSGASVPRVPETLRELLLGGRRGLLAFSPVYVALVPAIGSALRSGTPLTRIERLGMAVPVAGLVLLSFFPELVVKGPGTVNRHLVMCLPLALIPLARLRVSCRTAWMCGVPLVLAGLWASLFGPLDHLSPLGNDLSVLLGAPRRLMGRVLPMGWLVPVPHEAVRTAGIAALAFLLAAVCLFVVCGRDRPFRFFLLLALLTGVLHHGLVLTWLARNERWDTGETALRIEKGAVRILDVEGARAATRIEIAFVLEGGCAPDEVMASRISVQGERGETVVRLQMACDGGVQCVPERTGESGITQTKPPGGPPGWRMQIPAPPGRPRRVMLETAAGVSSGPGPPVAHRWAWVVTSMVGIR